MKTSACRSCGEPVIWCEMPSGKRMPVDVEPSSSGTVVLEEAPGVVLGKVVTAGSDPDARTSHFATCPQSNEWRKTR